MATKDPNDVTMIVQNSASKVLRDVREIQTPVIEAAPIIMPPMLKPVELIKNNMTINTQSFEYLVDSNSIFLVVGIIGMRGVGKSTIMNLLTLSGNGLDVEETLFLRKEGIFPISSYCATSLEEGIQMYITQDRTILLDCSSVLNNPFKKDCSMTEIDDLKQAIFLLSVCHLVLVVQEDFINTNFIRLIRNAEMMKPLFVKDAIEDHFAQIMFVKNLGNRHDFTTEARLLNNRIYKEMFKVSKLNIYQRNFTNNECKDNLNINSIVIPKVDTNRK